jgi:two-component system, NtrC family, C4-dicarboxylate transport response regulator DctD
MHPSLLLCVDDRPELLKVRKAVLESCGNSVEISATIANALKVLENNPVAAVLVDYKSEGLDAQAVACHIKQRYADQPIILLSAHSEMPETILWLVDEYVMRSEPIERLAQVIERVKRSPKTTNVLNYRSVA